MVPGVSWVRTMGWKKWFVKMQLSGLYSHEVPIQLVCCGTQESAATQSHACWIAWHSNPAFLASRHLCLHLVWLLSGHLKMVWIFQIQTFLSNISLLHIKKSSCVANTHFTSVSCEASSFTCLLKWAPFIHISINVWNTYSESSWSISRSSSILYHCKLCSCMFSQVWHFHQT